MEVEGDGVRRVVLLLENVDVVTVGEAVDRVELVRTGKLLLLGQPVCHMNAAHGSDKVLEQNRVISPSVTVGIGRIILALIGSFRMDCRCAVMIAGIKSHIAGIMEESGEVE